MASREGPCGETAHRSEGQRQRVGETRDKNDRRPGGQAEVVGEKKGRSGSRASRPRPRQRSTHQCRLPRIVRRRGRITIPTAISVPSAWKPATRFSTTRARKVKCVTALSRLTERRNCGSAHSSTSSRNRAESERRRRARARSRRARASGRHCCPGWTRSARPPRPRLRRAGFCASRAHALDLDHSTCRDEPEDGGILGKQSFDPRILKLDRYPAAAANEK